MPPGYRESQATMIVEICIFLVLVIAYYVVKDMKPKGMPPGPWEFPFLGNSPPLESKHILGLREKYGDVVTTRIAHLRTVLIYDYNTCKEAMASMDFVDRPSFLQTFSLDERQKGGVVFANGAQWQHDRRFLLKNLRNLGMGKTSLEAAIQTEAEAMVEDLRTYAGKTVEETPLSFRTAVLNVVWHMVAGKRYDIHSEDVNVIGELTNKALKDSTSLSQAYFLFPEWLKNILPKFIKVSVFRTDLLEQFLGQMKYIVDKHVIEGEEKLKNGTDGDDVISEYLREMKKHENEEDSLMWRGSLLQNVNDLFGAGSDTLVNMLKWSVFFLAKHPELAKEMQTEIDSVLSRGQFVSLGNKPDLPLVEAFITEALRCSSMVILNVQRSATRDTTIDGHSIPKGTMVVAVNVFIHQDPKFWENPQDFNPRRFITPEGKFRAPKEGFFAFGSGKRVCIGETLARMEYFLFTATLIQNFDIKVPEGLKFDETIVETLGFRLPKDQPLIFEYRS